MIVKKHDLALKSFLKNFIKKDIIGVFVYGSYATKKLRKDSDIDLLLVTNKTNTNIRANKIVKGIIIDYSIVSYKEIKNSKNQEAHAVNRPFSTMLKESKIILGKNSKIKDIKETAKKVYKTKIKPYSKKSKFVNREYLRNTIKRLKRLEDDKDSSSFNLTSCELIESIIWSYFKSKKRIMPKEVLEDIKQNDPVFYKLLSSALKETKIKKKYNKLKKLAKFLEEILGGPLPKEFEYSFK